MSQSHALVYGKSVCRLTVKSNRGILRHRHAAPLVDGLQDRLRDRYRPHALLAVRQQTAFTTQLTFEGLDLQCIGRTSWEALLGRAGPITHAHHVLWDKAQG